MPYKKLFFIFFIFSLLLYAKPLNFDELLKKPQSLVKDYYIYRLLQDNSTTNNQAQILYEQTTRMSSKLFNAFALKMTNNETIQKEYMCKKMSAKELLENDEECILMRISPSLVYNLDAKTRIDLAKKLEEKSPFSAKWLTAMNQENLFNALKESGAKEFLYVFNSLSKNIRVEKLDFSIPKEFLEELEKEALYETFLKNVVLGKAYLKNIPDSLSYFSNNNKLSHISYFLLGLNALKHEKNDLADFLFKKAEKSAYYKIDKDKSIFWRYLITQDSYFLEELAQSFDLNIYSLYAREILELPYINISKIDISEMDKRKIKYDMQDPFEWNDILEKIKSTSEDELENLAKAYKTPDTLAIYAFIQERVAKYKHHYFIFPHHEEISSLSKDRQALILSIARQESRFIPSAISTSYALGMMQFMPFLAENIGDAKKLLDFDIDDMFNPKIAYSFADYHIKYLNKHLNHPLFIAYAYNGGIGFTTRALESGMFKKGIFEPFMSIETLEYAESREYGKKVLANYVIYMYFLEEEVSIKNLFEKLLEPLEKGKSK